VTCLQVYSYFVDGCSGDSTALKGFVVALMCVPHAIMMARRRPERLRCIDTLHVALVTHALYWLLITNFGDLSKLGIVIWLVTIMVHASPFVSYFMQEPRCLSRSGLFPDCPRTRVGVITKFTPNDPNE
jgi:hypothetical protein